MHEDVASATGKEPHSPIESSITPQSANPSPLKTCHWFIPTYYNSAVVLGRDSTAVGSVHVQTLQLMRI